MDEPPAMHERYFWIMIIVGMVVLSCILAAFLLVGTLSGTCTPTECECPTGPLIEPLFTDPVEKIAALSDPSFARQLFAEAVGYEPLIATSGTQVHMGFWSGKGNHGSMLRVLDAINEGPATTADPPQRAIWDEGVNAYYNYPSYVRILDEHWYERAMAVNGTVSIFGKTYQDPHSVTFSQSDEIWGQYSARYTDMAALIANATGTPVKAWCFVEGASANRVFYMYEFPELERMEKEGVVQVYFARNQQADWTQPGDWMNGTGNAHLLISS